MIVFRRWQDGRVLGEELGDTIENRYGRPTTISTGLTSSLLADAFGRGRLPLDDV